MLAYICNLQKSLKTINRPDSLQSVISLMVVPFHNCNYQRKWSIKTYKTANEIATFSESFFPSSFNHMSSVFNYMVRSIYCIINSRSTHLETNFLLDHNIFAVCSTRFYIQTFWYTLQALSFKKVYLLKKPFSRQM